MGDITNVILFLLNELKNEKSICGHKYTSLFEIEIKRVEDRKDEQNILKHQISVLNLSNVTRVDISKYHEKDIILPVLKDVEKNHKQWIDLNMKLLSQYRFIPNEIHPIKSITEAIISFLYPSTNQVDFFYENLMDDSSQYINLDDIDYCLQTVLSFPKYLFIKINSESQSNDPEFIIDEKISFLKTDKNLIEYEIIGIVFFSGHHFYSLHRCWNSREPIWILYNDPKEPILFNGFFQEALLYFNLSIYNTCVLIYQDMQNIY
ncbi:hypothetical protein M9Y10_029149 [Tritrichomonas musculus]|uniref:USP domain-containing protein n=1 Tax=Tritrichomonas musculus TaxID=1915356 RepID=A0ABR2KLX6_9EUKA